MNNRSYHRRLLAAGLGLMAAGGMVAVFMGGCRAAGRAPGAHDGIVAYPPPPHEPHVVALGTLHGAAPPSRFQADVAMFLFGAELPGPLSLANPTGLAATEDEILVCDNALHMILRWGSDHPAFEPACGQDLRLESPCAIAIGLGGERLICDRTGVSCCDAAGRLLHRYRRDDVPFRPTGVLAVDDEVWVSNHPRHCIEVFARESGEHLRSIGKQGSGPGEFVLPLGMARTPDGLICVVDMLNNRVQVLDRNGTWVRNIGQAGDSVGTFGRPKAVAVGPDGTVFVTDAFSQRVHVFTPTGVPLLEFGKPGTGIGALTLPSGIAIRPVGDAGHALPVAPPPKPAQYYILVSEQLHNPGVRVYAWLSEVDHETASVRALPSGEALDWTPAFPESVAINPHWHPDRCGSCHERSGGAWQPIAPESADALCISCHDGVKAPADPHPIGRPATTALVSTPDHWPTVNGAIGCMTCHDIQRHCDANAHRPAVNYVLLRDYDVQRPLEYCATCHRPDVAGRFSPHRHRDETGRVRDDACFFCHTARPDMDPDGRRRFDPKLRVESSALCLNCHSPHWDLSRKGHVDRPVTPAIRTWMIMRELRLTLDAPAEELERMALADPAREPARLPLGQGRVTCYSCHNPHYTGLFPADSELGSLATNPQDRRSALRTDWINLCSECHSR